MTSPEGVPVPPPNFTIEKTLSKALQNLSIGDRHSIEEEIHGLGCRATEETPELLQRTLGQFDALLNDTKESDPRRAMLLRNVIRISQTTSTVDPNTPSWNSRCYLNDPDVRLRFLRKYFFVVDKAVDNFLLFLDVMTELFGNVVTERPVDRSDFSPEERKALKKSRLQFLPFKDPSGRRVFVSVGSANFHIQNIRTQWKIFMYQHWVVSKDVETQRRGIVFHTYPFDEVDLEWERTVRPKFSKTDLQIRENSVLGIPVRIVANHFYLKDTPFSHLLSVMYLYNMAPERRPITKIHFGEQTEILYKMASFGVAVNLMPMTPSGSIKFSNHCAWLDAIEKIESGVFDGSIVECPLMDDVVFRAGKGFGRENPGNAHFRELIHRYSPEHYQGDHKTKYDITKLVYDAIVQDRKGRFLEWWKKGNAWIIIQDPDLVRQKIAKAFRNYKHSKSRKESSSTVRKFDEATPLDDVVRVGKNPDTTISPGEINPLQEYYSQTPSSKRTKTCGLDCLTKAKDEENGEGEACFGKNFFPVGD